MHYDSAGRQPSDRGEVVRPCRCAESGERRAQPDPGSRDSGDGRYIVVWDQEKQEKA